MISRAIALVALLNIAGCRGAAPAPPAAPRPPAASSTVDAKTHGLSHFEQANALAEQHQYAQALTRYKEALAENPDATSILYNGGLAAYLAKDFASAIQLWKRAEEIDGNDWRVRTKLIQAYQAAGSRAARDAERTALFDMRKKGGDGELTALDFYCRDQFEVRGRRVLVFEHFELKGKFALRYRFVVLKETEDSEDFRLSLGSYESTTTIAIETRAIKKGERLYHLDGYYPGGEHRTFAFFNSEPSYDEIRKAVVEVLEGRTRALSSTKMTR
jgi:tetratricopeptide (TPR) repeat protein